MTSIAFAPATKELFVCEAAAAEKEAVRPGRTTGIDLTRLRQLGWPAPARLIDTARHAASAEVVNGVFVELLAALPLLAAAGVSAGPQKSDRARGALQVWEAAAGLALELVQGGRLSPKLVQRGTGRGGWEARWKVAPATAE